MKLRTKFFLWLGKEVLSDMDDDIYRLKSKTQNLTDEGQIIVKDKIKFIRKRNG